MRLNTHDLEKIVKWKAITHGFGCSLICWIISYLCWHKICIGFLYIIQKPPRKRVHLSCSLLFHFLIWAVRFLHALPGNSYDASVCDNLIHLHILKEISLTVDNTLYDNLIFSKDKNQCHKSFYFYTHVYQLHLYSKVHLNNEFITMTL